MRTQDDYPDDADQLLRGRALASPLRMRILRLCLHEARTNKELANELGMNPGTLLHHVRALVATGFLAAEDPRRGTRGAKEVPYRATGRSWNAAMPAGGPILIETFLQEIDGLVGDEIQVARLGLKLNAASRDEMLERFYALFEEYRNRPSDTDGVPISLLFAEHPELSRAERDRRRPTATQP